MAHILLVGGLLLTFIFFVILQISNFKAQIVCSNITLLSLALFFHEMICVRKIGNDYNIHYYKMINNNISTAEYRIP